MPPMDIAATDIRQRVAAGTDISALVPPTVAHYIHQQGLYRGIARS
jgi:nicotinate-nucleotide adenylyltransferase